MYSVQHRVCTTACKTGFARCTTVLFLEVKCVNPQLWLSLPLPGAIEYCISRFSTESACLPRTAKDLCIEQDQIK